MRKFSHTSPPIATTKSTYFLGVAACGVEVWRTIIVRPQTPPRNPPCPHPPKVLRNSPFIVIVFFSQAAEKIPTFTHEKQSFLKPPKPKFSAPRKCCVNSPKHPKHRNAWQIVRQHKPPPVTIRTDVRLKIALGASASGKINGASALLLGLKSMEVALATPVLINGYAISIYYLAKLFFQYLAR
jgi:hypothetical protein